MKFFSYSNDRTHKNWYHKTKSLATHRAKTEKKQRQNRSVECRPKNYDNIDLMTNHSHSISYFWDDYINIKYANKKKYEFERSPIWIDFIHSFIMMVSSQSTAEKNEIDCIVNIDFGGLRETNQAE